MFVIPNSKQFFSGAADHGGIRRMIEATGARAADQQGPFQQVAADICWHDCQIGLPNCLDLCLYQGPAGQTWA